MPLKSRDFKILRRVSKRTALACNTRYNKRCLLFYLQELRSFNDIQQDENIQ